MPQRQLTTPLPVATEEAASCPTCLLPRYGLVGLPAPSVLPHRNPAHCGGCSPPDITSIIPKQLAASINTSPRQPTWSACLRGSTLTTLVTRTKVGNRLKTLLGPGKSSSGAPQGRGSPTIGSSGVRTVPVGGATGGVAGKPQSRSHTGTVQSERES